MKDLGKNKREPSDHIGNEPTPDIHIEGSELDINYKAGRHMAQLKFPWKIKSHSKIVNIWQLYLFFHIYDHLNIPC